MVGTWLESLVIGMPASHRALGYLPELQGISRRVHRVRSAWQPHLERTRQVLRAASELPSSHRKALLLGAGLLYDVPIESIASRFREVILVDAAHPLSSRWRTRKLKNVRRVTQDLTGTLDAIYATAHDPTRALPVARPMGWADDPELDWVASVNLLSQLPCMPAAYLAEYANRSVETVTAYARQLISAHLDDLARFRCRTTLITDVERRKIDTAGTVLETKDLLFGVPPPSADATWTWLHAPTLRGIRYERRVIARTCEGIV